MVHLKNSLAAGLLALAAFSAGAEAQEWEYLDHADGINVAAGNANAANLAIQTPTPWPEYVDDVDIPGHGQHGSAVIDSFYKRYLGGPTTLGAPPAAPSAP